MILRYLKATIEAFRRTRNYSTAMSISGRPIILGALGNFVRQNLVLILAAVAMLTWFGLDYFAISVLGASFSLVTLGADVSIVTRVLSFLRIFATPFDDLFVGILVTIGMLLIFFKMTVNYFKSQLRDILEDDE